MLRQLTPREWEDWKAYAELEPFGSVGANYHAAIIAKTLMDVHGWKKNDGTPFTYEDFILKFSDALPPQKKGTQSPATKLAFARILAEAAAASEREKKKKRR